MSPADKPLRWLAGEVKSLPFDSAARLQAGFLLRQLQRGNLLSLPHSRPMPIIGPRCHELRVIDKTKTWRILYRLDADAILILEVFAKKSRQTPRAVILTSQKRLQEYDRE